MHRIILPLKFKYVIYIYFLNILCIFHIYKCYKAHQKLNIGNKMYQQPYAIGTHHNIIIFSKTPQEHLSHICMVFQKLKSANLSMKKSKCSFFSKEIQYLGHILSATCIWPLPSKTHAIQKISPPTTPKQVRAFLRLVGYYRKFIRGFAKIAKPLTMLTRQQVKFDWTPEHQEAFIHLKEAIVLAPILHYPKPNKTYIVYTDASDDACGAQLS